MSEQPSLPDVTDPQWEPFWRHARDGELWAPGCGSCGAVWWPPGSPRCPECLGTDVQWRPLEGRGQVWSVAIYHRAFQPAFAADVPYTVALVELANGVAMVGRVIGARPLAPGDEAVAVFERVTDEVTLIRFAAADPEQETDGGR